MIIELGNAFITMMLAKFIINDLPHAVGLLEPSRLPCTTLVPKPAYDVPEGVYSWQYLVSVTPRSAYDAVLYTEALGRHGKVLPPLGGLSWQYTQLPVGTINSWVYTFSKYVRYRPEDFSRLVGTFPLEDYFELSTEAEYYRPRWGHMSPEEEEEMREGFSSLLYVNTVQANHIMDKIVATGVYYPPIVMGDEVLDGAHRLAVLWGHCGPEFKVWVWRAL